MGHCVEPDWISNWTKRLAEYLRMPPRQGMYLECLFPNKRWSFLELAAGSMRDANYLANRGYESAGSDSTSEVVEMARRAHENERLSCYVLDAFNTGLGNGSFDVTFHNGFWGYFSDAEIAILAREQVRITRRYMVVTVHCAHNQAQKRRFEELAAEDTLYGIRFFTRDEIVAKLASYGRSSVYAFGSSFDRYLFRTWGVGRLPLPIKRLGWRIFSRVSDMHGWERLMVVTRVN